MSYLRTLKNNLSQLQEDKREYEAQIETQKARRESLETLKIQMGICTDSATYGINASLDSVTSYLSLGVAMDQTFVVRGEEMSLYKEKDAANDSCLGQALSDVNQEITQVENKIDQLSQSKQRVQNDIVQTQNEIYWEEQRLAEEERREAERRAAAQAAAAQTAFKRKK